MSRTLLLMLFCVVLPATAVAGDELDQLGGGDDTSTRDEPAPAVPVPAPVPALPSLTELQGEADAGVRATLLVTLALDRLAGLEVLVAGTPAGPERDAVQLELVGLRQALHSALVEVGRLREDGDLRLWLVQQGLAQSAVTPPPESAPAPEPGEPTALTVAEFDGLTHDIDGVAFTTGKMQVLVDRLSTRRITTGQARGLVELFSFSRDRVDALIFLHPRIQDPENFDGLLSALKFESDRASVRSQLGLDG